MIARLREMLTDELRLVEVELSRALHNGQPLVDEVGDWLIAVPGKRLRPILTLLAERCYRDKNAPSDEMLPRVAATMELIHTASLLQDDVIDHALLRRGRETVNARWGNDVAILIADLIYLNVFDTAQEAVKKSMLSMLAGSTARMCEGELLQIERRNEMFSLEDYYFVATRKTAGLFSSCVSLGAQLGGAEQEQINAMNEFGVKFGLLFQITDDLLDFMPSTQTGKPRLADLSNRKQSLPVVLAYSSANTAEKAEFVQLWRNPDTSEKTLLYFVRKHNGEDRARKLAKSFADEASTILCENAPECEARAMLKELVEFVLNRKS
ncbi:MAG: polyprenyl synthetase family protein [Candidatus Sumerlaeales bacterium]|nr:polyprenyl synthetase family protein [Candidatus Sumerlaeales bacterium]